MHIGKKIAEKIIVGTMVLASVYGAHASQSSGSSAMITSQPMPTNDAPATTISVGSVNASIYNEKAQVLESSIISVRISKETNNTLLNILSTDADSGVSFIFIELTPSDVKKMQASLSTYQGAIANQIKKAPVVSKPLQQTLATMNLVGYWQQQGLWETTGTKKGITTTLLLRYVNTSTYSFIMSLKNMNANQAPTLLYLNDTAVAELQSLLTVAQQGAKAQGKKSIDQLYPSAY